MVCVVKLLERPKVKKPVLVEGLPGMGFVANIAATHMIKEFGARKFATIISSSFQDFAMTVGEGSIRFPVNELYYCPRQDLIILYGNTQAEGSRGQYELCWEVLKLAKRFRCRMVLTMGGYGRRAIVGRPKVYCAATNRSLLEEALKFCDGVVVGNIYGAAGLLLGLGKMMGLEGVCFLAETTATHPDPRAALEVLKAVSGFLGLKINLERLARAAEFTEIILRGGPVEEFSREKQP